MKSIRVFLVVSILALLVLVVFIAAVRGFQNSMAEAMALFDAQLREQSELTIYFGSEKRLHPSHSTYSAYQLWSSSPNEDPQLVARSDNMPREAIVDLKPGYGYANFSGYRWRTYVHLSSDTGLVAVAAARMDVRYQLAEDVLIEAIIPIVILLPVSGLLVWFIIGAGLQPLRSLVSQLKQKESRDLTPIQLPNHPVELAPVVLSINSLLHRLQSAFDREKRFTSDAAHELRIPISALKIQIYNLEEKYPDHSMELGELRAGVERMQYLVEQILDLYRVSPEQLSAQFRPVDLLALAQTVIADKHGDFEKKQQTIELVESSTGDNIAPVVQGDDFALKTLVSNLLSNAEKYTPRGGRIQVELVTNDNSVCLKVEDNGPGIAPEQRERIFERFHRVGGDRHSSGEPGCGLGLAIVKNIVDLHNATIVVKDSSVEQTTQSPDNALPTVGACFKITFPRYKGGH